MFVIGTRESYYFGLKRIVKRIVKFNNTERNIAVSNYKKICFGPIGPTGPTLPKLIETECQYIQKNVKKTIYIYLLQILSANSLSGGFEFHQHSMKLQFSGCD